MEPRRLIEQHLSLVAGIASQVASSFPRHIDRRELARAGALGLVEAAGRYDPDRGVPFRRYATARIKGAILDTVRAADWAPRSPRTSARELNLAEQRLAVRFGRVPSNTELAEELATTSSEIAELRGQIVRSVVLALECLAAAEGGVGIDDSLADRTAVEPGEALEGRELTGYLRDAIRLLPDRHRRVIVGYFLDGQPSHELAGALEVTESRISQLRTEALTMLRHGIEAQYGAERDVGGGRAAEGGRAAARQARYTTAIGAASPWWRRVEDAAPDTVCGPASTLPLMVPDGQTAAPSNTAALIPLRASSVSIERGGANSARPPAPNRERRPSTAQAHVTAATVPVASAGRSIAP